jgi:cobalt-zinc-cadmium efflux system outer membrane protein
VRLILIKDDCVPAPTQKTSVWCCCVKQTVSFLALLVLSGCATYHAQPLAPAQLMKAFEARTLDSPDLQRYVAAHRKGDASRPTPNTWDLTTLTLAAFYFSPELDVARAKAGASQAAIQTAGQHPNPSLQFPLAYTSNAKAGESPYTYGLGLDIPIETAGKRGYRVAQAQQLSNAARLNIGNVAWQVRSRLRSHLLNLYAAVRKVEILQQQITTQQQIVAMLEKRLDLGAASAPEANQARIALTQNRIDLAHVQQQRQDERAQIAAAIGVPVSAMTYIKISFDTFGRIYPDIPADDARRQAILNRADVLAALSEYEASQAALQLEIANQYPDIHIGPGYTFDAGAHKFVLPLSGITLPLFNQNQGPIAQASARRTEVAAHVNAVQAQAIDDTERAVQNYRAALANLRLADSLLSAQQRQLQDRQKTFNAGETDRLTLALAQHNFYINALARQDALVQVQTNIGQLEDAMQRPLSASDFIAVPDIEENKK